MSISRESTVTSTALVGEEKFDVDNVNVRPEAPIALDALDIVQPPQYRLYRRRWAGLVALFLLNVISGMSWPWFGPISNTVADRFHFSLTQVNWLGNTVALVFLPMSFVIPPLCQRFGIRTICLGAGCCILVASWLRYAGTANSLSSASAYTLMILAQILVGVAQPIYQVIGPKFSELWFDLKFRTTATMIIAIANPLGSALGQLLSPLVSDVKSSILLLGIIGTVIAPLSLVIQARPPLPPTYAASTPSPPMLSTFRALLGKARPGEEFMEVRERIDFIVLNFVFSQGVAAVATFSILTNEIFEPYGYSETFAGLSGAALLLSGIVAAIVSAPILDRLLTHHLGLTIRILMPILAAGWIGFIFAVRPNDIVGIFICLVLIGIASLILLPVGLEVGCEVTRNPETSSAMMWFSGNAANLIYLPIETALKAGDDGNPPHNLRRGLMFQGIMVGIAAVVVFGLRGRQARRERDVNMAREAAAVHELPARSTP